MACIADGSGCPLTGKISKNMRQVKELVLENRTILSLKFANIRKYIWVSLEHFQRQSKYVQISINSVPSAKHGNEGESCQDMLGLPKKASKDLEIFSVIPRIMRHQFLDASERPHNSCHSGRAHNLYTKKWQVKFADV